MPLPRHQPRGAAPRQRPRKRFGQHYLEAAWADKVIDAIDPRPTDRFLEIGPGPGALTTRLAPRVARLTAIEVDRDLATELRRTLHGPVDVVTADFLTVELRPFVAAGPVRVAGNLPYNISSPILFKLLEASRDPGGLVDATLMLQYEVAQRLVAAPGTAEYGVLTLLTALYADVVRLLVLPPGAFRPAPKVRSAVVRLTFRPPPVDARDPALLERLVRSVFTQRRKTLLNALRRFAEAHGGTAAGALSAASIDPQRRPETLTLAEAARLSNLFAHYP